MSSPTVSSPSANPPRNGRRVVITGLGAITPVGLDMTATWNSLVEGRSGIGPITRFDASKLPVRIAGEVKNFKFEPWISTKDVRKMGLFIQYAIVAASEAFKDAGLAIPFNKDSTGVDPERAGVCVSAGMGGLPEIEYWDRELAAKEKKSVTPFFVPMIIPNLANGHLSIMANAQGPNTCIVTACASSAHAVGESARYIRDGYCDLMVAGGAEAVISELGLAGFSSMRALSTRNDEPSRASRPYDQNRDGFVLAEGAAILILEELEHAQRRGARIYGEVVGYGLNSDAYHITSPAPEGAGAERCMRQAIATSGLTHEDIGYVNSHGTSTPMGDAQEAQAIGKAFAGHTNQLHVSSTKSMTGHLLGAAGALEAAVTTLAIFHGTIPPTINLDTPDPESAATGLNFTPHKAVRKPLKAALSNSFGFGGTNASLVIKKFDPHQQ